MDEMWLVVLAVCVAGLGAVAAWVSTPIMSASASLAMVDDATEGVSPHDEAGVKELRAGIVDKAKTTAFPSLMHDEATVDLTLVVPAYKEETRLPKMMEETLPALRQLEREDGVQWEILIVDDGSSDRTSEVAARLVAEHRSGDNLPVRLCRLKQNRGKGGAVRMGMMRSRGRFLLMIDADGATAAPEIIRIYRSGKKLVDDKGHAMVVGSRADAEDGTGSKAKRHGLRALTQWGMRMAVRVIGGVYGIRDTQCGFKLFARNTARVVFPPLHIERWAFDVEVLYLATLQPGGVPTLELPVEWNEIEGSHLEVVSASLQMIRDMLATRLCYTLGIWSKADGARRSGSCGTSSSV
ncbi:hypothetical protein FNF29_04213 [Cafeteria roenbergensis]|uniref:dolichyl-phosphate beta-glucosyltransferase n=1 Tax=Cafeteria roenbergensis TaxID=33653 RepID=A0A5A8CHI4_CAFRO|nr:hypothetical protein FNF29_04213 [Cafeteria roenbergensis]|eukprot:KAA0152099.1 hypothetical protein FNF29_04213 [Cafeteria roenbergensis]